MMNDMITRMGMELDVLSPGDIVTPLPINPQHSFGCVVRVIAANAAVVVVERLVGPFEKRRETLEMRAYKWFEASELLDALSEE